MRITTSIIHVHILCLWIVGHGIGIREKLHVLEKLVGPPIKRLHATSRTASAICDIQTLVVAAVQDRMRNSDPADCVDQFARSYIEE
jgi:hypothetical protein